MVSDKEKDKKKKESEEKPDFKSDLTDAYKSFDTELTETQKKDSYKKQEVLEQGIERVEKKSQKDVESSKILVRKLLDMRRRAGAPSAPHEPLPTCPGARRSWPWRARHCG